MMIPPDPPPILILDDVFAELDSERRHRLGALVAQAEQVLLTSAVLSDIPEELGTVPLSAGECRSRRICARNHRRTAD